MAFIKPSVKLIIRERKQYRLSGPVLSFGVPEIYATHAELRAWFPLLAGEPCPLEVSQVRITSNPVGRKLEWVDAQSFFMALGLTDVVTLDIPGCEHRPDLIHDLNRPLPEDMLDHFNLLLDPGSLEHVFDVKTAFSNVVRALKVGGVAIHQLPIYMYNGGYFSVNPNVVNDFYRNNGFSDLKTFVIMWDRYHAYTATHSRCYEYTEGGLMSQRHALVEFDQVRYCPILLFFARKARDVTEIVSPLQHEGHYVSGGLEPGEQTSGEPVTASFLRWIYRRATGTLDCLPFAWAFPLKAVMARYRMMHKTRHFRFDI